MFGNRGKFYHGKKLTKDLEQDVTTNFQLVNSGCTLDDDDVYATCHLISSTYNVFTFNTYNMVNAYKELKDESGSKHVCMHAQCM